MKITSTAFENQQPIPARYTGEGEDVSPPLSWNDVPENTRELVLICDDPDAPTPEPWVHWLIYRISPDTTSLPEGVPRESELQSPIQALQGKNSWPPGEQIGYRGPYPPKGHGTHRYFFKLYALSSPLNLGAEVEKNELLQAMQGRILEKAELIGTYVRNK